MSTEPPPPGARSYAEYAGIYDRAVYKVTTAANGDVLAGGIVSKEQVKPDTGGYLWLARFSPTGALLWSRELPAIDVVPRSLLETSTGDILCGAASITLKASGEIVISGLKITLSADAELKLSAPKISGG